MLTTTFPSTCSTCNVSTPPGVTPADDGSTMIGGCVAWSPGAGGDAPGAAPGNVETGVGGTAAGVGDPAGVAAGTAPDGSALVGAGVGVAGPAGCCATAPAVSVANAKASAP